MASIQVTATTLKTQADTLRQYNSSFKSAVGELESIEGQLNSMWEGEANTAFHTAFHNDKVQMDNFYNAIEMYANVLTNIATRYEQAESVNTDTATTRNY